MNMTRANASAAAPMIASSTSGSGTPAPVEVGTWGRARRTLPALVVTAPACRGEQAPAARSVSAALIALVKSAKYWAAYVSALFRTPSSWALEKLQGGIEPVRS